MSQYVQHISAQGQKFEVVQETPVHWLVFTEARLPKSEYRLCEPPEVWRDVTEECVVMDSSYAAGPHKTHLEDKHFVFARVDGGYRLRKIQVYDKGWAGTACPRSQAAFIVEKKENAP